MASVKQSPWRAVSCDGTSWSVVQRAGDKGYFIAQVMPHTPGDPTGEDNARLIADAPVMLDILRKIASWHEADPERYVAGVDALVLEFLCARGVV
jgi:hypothetical protein